MELSERDIRKVINTKESSLEFQGTPSIGGMVEGQVAIQKKSNSQLALYRKKFGKLWKSYMSADGNQIVDKTLTAKKLIYTHEFIDYRIFIHNYTKNTDGNETFLPWNGTGEQTSMDNATSGFLVPYNMTCEKILFRAEPLDNMTYDITFKVYKQDNDQTADEVSSYTYTSTLSNDTAITINRADFNNPPRVEANDKVGISIDFATDPGNDTVDFYVTSVWRVEVTI
tara:strand:- start:1710 stop:2390 length:681 start_codon:yes stop_codon:yes gene_type:complete